MSYTIAKNFNTKDYFVYDENDEYLFTCDTEEEALEKIAELNYNAWLGE